MNVEYISTASRYEHDCKVYSNAIEKIKNEIQHKSTLYGLPITSITKYFVVLKKGEYSVTYTYHDILQRIIEKKCEAMRSEQENADHNTCNDDYIAVSSDCK